MHLKAINAPKSKTAVHRAHEGHPGATQVYYYNKQAQRTEVRGCWCHSCWNEAKEGLVQLDGSTVPKKDLDKRKNDEEVRQAC